MLLECCSYVFVCCSYVFVCCSYVACMLFVCCLYIELCVNVWTYIEPCLSRIFHSSRNAADNIQHYGGLPVAVIGKGDKTLYHQLAVKVEGQEIAAKRDSVVSPASANETNG